MQWRRTRCRLGCGRWTTDTMKVGANLEQCTGEAGERAETRFEYRERSPTGLPT